MVNIIDFEFKEGDWAQYATISESGDMFVTVKILGIHQIDGYGKLYAVRGPKLLLDDDMLLRKRYNVEDGFSVSYLDPEELLPFERSLLLIEE